MKKWMRATMALTLTAALLAGCGGASSGGGASSSGGSGNGNQQAAEGNGMGRYVEEMLGQPSANPEGSDANYSYIKGIASLSDGSLRTMVVEEYYPTGEEYSEEDSRTEYHVLSSADGKSWTDTGFDLMSVLGDQVPEKTDGVWVNVNVESVAWNPAGDMVLSAAVYASTTEERDDGTYSITDEKRIFVYGDKDGNYRQLPVAVDTLSSSRHDEYKEEEGADIDNGEAGEVIAYETGEDDIIINEGGDPEGGNDDDQSYSYLSSMKLAENGNLFICDDNSSIYMISTEDGSLKKTISDMEYVSYIALCGDRLMSVGWDNAFCYDTATGEKAEDISGFVDVFNSSRGIQCLADSPDSGKLYSAGSDGIFCYDVASGENTRLVDGALTSMVSPDAYVEQLIVRENEEFMTLFEDYSLANSRMTLYKYTYDPSLPSRPDEQITVYSLYDDYAVRQMGAMFQKSHPEIYVAYEFGISGEDAVTSSDAIRTLNTEIMAGNGPDIIMMDGLPVASYVEKGLLMDIKDVVDKVSAESGLFDNVARTYETDGKLYAIPAAFTMPVIIGRQEMLDQINSIEDLGKAAADFAVSDHTQYQKFMDEYSLLTLFGALMPASSADWFKEDGSLDGDKLKAYFEQVIKTTDACKEALTEESRANMDSYMEWFNDPEMDTSYTMFSGGDPSWNTMEILAGLNQIALGNLSGTEGLEYLYSANKQDSAITYKAMPGALSNVYVPTKIFGISGETKEPEAAKAFLEYMLGPEAADSTGGYNGFPVNMAAFDQSVIDPNIGQEWYTPGQSTGGIGTTDENGNELTMEVYWPTEEYCAEMKALLQTLDTPAYTDEVILDYICKDCLPAVTGQAAVDDCVNQVLQDINIYLSE